jgi:hypothetical protein
MRSGRRMKAERSIVLVIPNRAEGAVRNLLFLRASKELRTTHSSLFLRPSVVK